MGKNQGKGRLLLPLNLFQQIGSQTLVLYGEKKFHDAELHILSNLHQNPPTGAMLGFLASKVNGTWVFVVSSSTLKFLMIVATPNLMLIRANLIKAICSHRSRRLIKNLSHLIPMQFLGPSPNGMKVKFGRLAVSSGVNRSGSNWSGFFQ